MLLILLFCCRVNRGLSVEVHEMPSSLNRTSYVLDDTIVHPINEKGHNNSRKNIITKMGEESRGNFRFTHDCGF